MGEALAEDNTEQEVPATILEGIFEHCIGLLLLQEIWMLGVAEVTMVV